MHACIWRMPEPSSATPRQVGANLQAALERAGLSQGEFARRMGVHPTTAGRLITGEINMSVTTLVQAAEVVGIPPCELLGDVATTCTGGVR